MAEAARAKPKYPGIRVTCNGNFLVTQYVEVRVTEGGVFYPITPSTEGGEIYQASFASGELNVWGQLCIDAGAFPPDLDTQKRSMTLEHLLTMSSGFF